MKNAPRRGLEVYDFVEEDEFPDPVVKFSAKFKNPSREDRRKSKVESLKPGSKKANVQAKEISSIPCVDVDEGDTDRCCKNAITHPPLETIQEELASEKELKFDDATESKILSHEQQSDLDKVSSTHCTGVDVMDHDHCSDSAILHSRLGTMEEDAATQSNSHEQQSDLDDNGCRNFLSKIEIGVSNAPSPSPGKSQLDCGLTVSPSNNDPVDVMSDADESTSESPSSPLSPIEEDDCPMEEDDCPMEEDDYPMEEDDGSLGTYKLGHCSGNFEMDNVNMTVVLYPDYVVYGDSYCTGAQQLTFSHSCIKISGLVPSESDETLNFEWGVDDVVNVECQWVQNAEFVMIKLRVLSKDADRDDDALGISGIEELKIGVVEPNWSQQQERIACLNDKYLDILDPVQIMEVGNSLGQRHYFPNFDEDFENFVYPEGDPDSVTISKRDVDLLQPEIFINDTLIDFYIKYLENQIQPDEKHRFYFFNSFFFRKLVDLDKDPSSVAGGRAAFQRVRKWTRKVDLFEKDYIFIPVNFNLHWTLIVICHPGEMARYNVRDSGKAIKVPCILHLDSLKGSHTGLKNHVQSYLWEEWKEKKKETSEEISSNFHNLRFLSLELPQQENTYDCGLFLLHYLELFLEEAPAIFNPFHINKFSTFLNANWFCPSEASLKRTLIQRLIFELIENRYREVCLPACSDVVQAKYPGCNQLEIGAEFLSGRSSPAIACQANISNSQEDNGIEMTLLPTSSLRSSECVSDAGLVLREFFQSGEAAGSLFGQYQSFEHKSPFYHPNGAKPEVEEETQTGEQFTYLATGDGSFQEISEITSQTCGIQCSSKSFVAEISYNLGMSVKAPNENIGASPDRSITSDHSEGIEIIENGDHSKAIQIIEDDAVGEDLGPSQNGEMDVQNDPSLQSIRCVVESLVSGLGEMQSGFLIEEGSQEHGEVHDGHAIGGPSRREEGDVLTYPSTENVVCLADGLISGSGDMKSTSVIEESPLDQKEVHVGNENRGSLPSSQEISDMPIQEDVGAISCDNGFVDESQELESEEQQAAKRMRLTPDEGEKCLA
ncbi:hypothetical protein ACLB2K_050861 [Fragaria x ananassa]